MEMIEAGNGSSWQARLKTTYEQRPACPEWATLVQQNLWREADVVLWNAAQRAMISLHAVQAVDLLNQAKESDAWRAQGLTVCAADVHALLRFATKTSDQPQVTRTGVHLDAEQVAAVLPLLQDGEALLREQLVSEAQRLTDAIVKAQRMLFRHYREREAKRLNMSSRPIAWIHQDDWRQPSFPRRIEDLPKVWVADVPPNRGTVRLILDGLAWQGYLERPGRPIRESKPFGVLEEALAWTERELAQAANEDAKEAAKADAEQNQAPPKPVSLSLATLTAAHRDRLAPYWIAPSALEPKRLTFRAVIYVRCAATSQKYWEFSFGQKVCYDETYPTVVQLARMLGIDTNVMDIYAMVGGLYRLTSLATFGDAAAAAAQAQRQWERGSFASAYRDKKILSAAYGTEEVETMYRRWEGWYGDWDDGSQDREAYLAEQALELTIDHALDLEGFRTVLLATPEDLSDEEALRMMHQSRAESPAIPEQARQESRRWLTEHGHA
jgi:hypothetical protein